MKKGNAKDKGRRKTPTKDRAAKIHPNSQPKAIDCLTAEGIMTKLFERNLEAVGKQLLCDLDLLLKAALLESSKSGLSDYESTAAMRWVIESVTNRFVEMLRAIEKQTAHQGLRNEVQDQMVYSARRFSDAAFEVLDRTANDTSKVMTLSLVRYITGQLDSLKKISAENPQSLRWIAEDNVFWPSVRALYETYSDNFPDVIKNLNLGGRLPIRREGKLNPNTPAYQEVLRFMRQVRNGTHLFSVPSIRRKEKRFAAWKRLLDLYLRNNRGRLVASSKFQYVRQRARLLQKGNLDGYAFSEIKKDCIQALKIIVM